MHCSSKRMCLGIMYGPLDLAAMGSTGLLG